MKIGDLVLVKFGSKQSWPQIDTNSWNTVGMIMAIDVLDYSGECDPWTAYKVLVGDEIITTHTGKIRPLTRNIADNI